jgi:hypothetical protein
VKKKCKLSLWVFIYNKPKGCFVSGCFVSGCFVSTDVLSPRTFGLPDVLSLRMFCLYGRFVPTDVLSLGRYVSSVLSPDVLSPVVLSLRTFCLLTFCLGNIILVLLFILLMSYVFLLPYCSHASHVTLFTYTICINVSTIFKRNLLSNADNIHFKRATPENIFKS